MPGEPIFPEFPANKKKNHKEEYKIMSVVNTNVNALVGLSNLYKTNKGISSSLEKLSSGYRINKGADDPSGLAIASKMSAQISGIRVAVQNAEDGANMIQTADGALAETTSMLLRMRDLALRSANEATLTDADKDQLDVEFQALMTEITDKATRVTYNTKEILNGDVSGDDLQVGPGSADTLAITIDTVTAATLGINADDIGAGGSPSTAIDNLSVALSAVADDRANLGALQNRLGYIVNDLMAADINLSAARSRILDADMAREISEFTRLQILQQSGTAILAQANAQPQSVLQLLG